LLKSKYRNTRPEMSLGFAGLLFMVRLCFLIPEAIYQVQNDVAVQKDIGRSLDIVVAATDFVMDVVNNKDDKVIEKDVEVLDRLTNVSK